ncbi:MAG: D-arabinose 5-phosphate isomerase [Gammaproteobacteria bacterium RIFOXYB2_FULL_38_6]|nr:MAG: D-arabinose 5-phosphate isomerase [Gammaproteobacteria bacterium RIFOXYB2_FULL_38_6]
MEHSKAQEFGRSVIETELEAISVLKKRIDENFSTACEILLNCEGHVVVLGMGKSGHIGNKIAATLASTGTPAFFVHPGEAGHGDMGMITRKDVVIAISNSGETPEILTLLPALKQASVPLITMTGQLNSTLAKNSTVNLDISAAKEACSIGLVPTSSTTTTLVMGDALAVTLLELRGFTQKDFAKFHPGGDLGKRLLLRVDDIMHSGKAIPKVNENTLLTQALLEMTQKTLGMTTIVSEDNKLLGIYTDGDLRRTLDKNLNIHKTFVKDVMTRHPITIQSGTLAAEALHVMEEHKITSLVVINENMKVMGVVHIHDLF